MLKDAKVVYTYRIFLLIILPLLVGYFVLPHTQVIDGTPLDAPVANPNDPTQNISYSFAHSNEEVVGNQRISTLFPLAGYLDFPPFVSHSDPMICFQDEGSYLTVNQSNQPPDVRWDVILNNQDKLTVKTYSTNCTHTKSDQNLSYGWYASIKLPPDINLSASNVTFTPKTKTYPRIIMDYGLLQGLILIPVAYLFIWYPAAGILRKIKKGFEEQ
ncbi:Uncharacterised protein [Candidatus Bilamarchaeum dharawalense]|uniref:Uncharacterized protein n=1 Tax=Candidatus Bilamarchaeum dharawalense TaxID=2885759 RepID=A0A5E4LP44_9ARCH|nr:Uncharacterised protein [Candidatus Bilamarchaeum dharawalense]